MSEQNATPKVKRKWNKMDTVDLQYAKKRFAEFASTSAVRAELKAKGSEYSHSQLHYYWTLANPKPSDADPGDECVCAETSTRNCPEHQNGGGC